MESRLPYYLLSLPERVLRSASALAGGLLHEIGRSALPEVVRKSRLYVNLVELTLRILIEEVGQVEGVFPSEEELNKNLILRRTAGGGLETIGILAFYASPVWVLAVLADVSGAGRYLLADITGALKEAGLIDRDAEAGSVDQMLDALERSAGQAANSINAPPLDVEGLRKDWAALKLELGKLPPNKIPPVAMVTGTWDQINLEAKRQGRSVFEMSTVIALSTVGTLPEKVYWLSQAAKIAGERTGYVLAGPLLSHYRQTLTRIREVGFTRYWISQFRPYLRSAAAQFAPEQDSWTERTLQKSFDKATPEK
jgi:hypothetical protein